LAVLLLAGCLALPARVRAEAPTTGMAAAGFEGVEREVRAFMELVRCQAAAVAVARDGKLLYSRGFGWRDRARKTATPPDALFRVGSVTKPITAAAVKELVRAGKLGLDTKAFPLLALEPPRGARVDPRLDRITVGQLLEHRGGWDANRSFDPLFRPGAVQRELRLGRPPGPTDLVRWMMARPLDFDPDSRSAYSNFGYCVLGRVIEKATGKRYGEALTDLVLKPWKIQDIRVGRTAERDRPEREVWHPPTDATFTMEAFDSSAGLVASAPSVCAFLRRYWIPGDRREAGQVGAGRFFGSLPGATALAEQRRDGVDFVALFNNRRDASNEADQRLLLRKLTAAVDRALKE
jgi:CubicO group peptidase (beta-lactamase class C family)